MSRSLLTLSLVVLSLLPALSPAQTADTPPALIEVAAPDPALTDHTALLQAAVAQCAGKVNPILRLHPGTYRLTANTEQSQKSGLLFSKLNGLTLDGQGAVLLMSGKMTPLSFRDCAGITVKNLTIDWAKPYFSQGKVVAATNSTLDVEIDPAFPLPREAKIHAFMDYDPQTRLPLANLDVFGEAITKTEWLDDQHVRLELRRSGNPRQNDYFAKWLPKTVGKLLVLRQEVYGNYGMTFLRSRDITLDHVTIYTAPGMSLHAQECENITSRGVQIRIKPNSGRLMSSTADCQYYTFCKGTIRIEDGYYEGMGDDGFNSTAKYRQVIGRESATVFFAALPVKIGWRGPTPLPGEKLTFQRGRDLTTLGTWTVKSAVWEPGRNRFRIEMTDPLPDPLATGDLWYSETYMPKVEIRRSTFRGMRSRAILLSTRDVLIENCKIESPGFSGILFKGGLRHGAEGPAPSDVIIRSNTFEGCGGAAIYGYADGPSRPAGILHDITIENNTIRDIPALAAQRSKQDDPLRTHWTAGICLLSLSDSALRGNTFEGYPIAIYLQQSRNVCIENNQSSTPSQIMLDAANTADIHLGTNTRLEKVAAPSGVLSDIDYINLFR